MPQLIAKMMHALTVPAIDIVLFQRPLCPQSEVRLPALIVS